MDTSTLNIRSTFLPLVTGEAVGMNTDATPARRIVSTLSPALLVALTACYGAVGSLPGAGVDLGELSDLDADDAFDEVASDADLPSDLLTALAWKASAFSPLEGDHEERAPVYGWMGLTDAQVTRAATLTGLTPEEIRTGRDASIAAGAALLDELRDEHAPGALAWSLNEQWWPVIVAWSDLDESWAAHEYAADVFAILQRGLVTKTWDGDVITIDPREIPGLSAIRMDPAPTEARDGEPTDYPGAARFLAAHSSNFSSRTGGVGAIDRVVIHTTEGSYDGAISWFRNSSSDVSAHYVIRKSDGHITQMVRDADRAWHAAGANADTIGIEHEGSAWNAGTWTPAMLESSARLGAWLADKYAIPVDRDHFVAHSEVTGYKHDPGDHFPWDAYLASVDCYREGNDCDPPVPGGTPDEPDEPTPGDDDDGDDDDAGGQPGDDDDWDVPWDWEDLIDSDGDGAWDCPPCDTSGDCGTCDATGTVDGGPCGECEGSTDCSSCEGDGEIHDGDIDGDEPYNEGTPSIEWVSPRDGDETGNPLALVADPHRADVVEFWSGPWKLGPASAADPANLDVQFTPDGVRTIEARALSETGAILAVSTITITVSDSADVLEVHGVPSGGLTWRMSSTVTASGVETVRYFVDGYALTDDETGSTNGVGEDWALNYTFTDEGDHRLLVARGYDTAGAVVAEDWMHIDVSETAHPECPILETLECGRVVSGTTAAAPASDQFDGYPEITGNWSGPEVGYTWFSAGYTSVEVGFVGSDPTQLDLDIIVLEDTDQTCREADAVEVIFNSFEIEVIPNTWYTFVVDGYDGAEGAFQLEIDCG